MSPEILSDSDKSYSRISLKELTESLAPFLDWTNFISKFLSTYNSTEKVDENTTIIVLGKEYLKNLTELINSENEETLKFYAYVNLLKYLVPLLSREFSSQLYVLREALTGATQPERWTECIDHIDNTNTLGFASSRMFIRRNFNGAKSAALDMIDRVRESIISNFPNNAWMDAETRRLAEEKIRYITEMIGYPEFIMNDTLLNKKYEQMFIDENDYFNNEIRLTRFGMKNNIQQYRSRVDTTEYVSVLFKSKTI